MTEHKLAHILRAIADGKIVQSKLTAYDPLSGRVTDFGWKDLDVTNAFSLFPTSPGMDYRIKPGPLVKKYKWIMSDSRNPGHLIVTRDHYVDRSDLVSKTMHGYFRPVEEIKSTMIEVEEE